MKFKIRTKLLIIFFSVITLYILIVGYASIYAIRLTYNSVNIINAVHREEHYSHDLQLAIDRILMPANDYIITGDKKYIDEFQKLSMDLEKLLKEADNILSDIERLTQTAETEEREILKDIETGWLNMKDLSLKILEIPDPVGNMDAARLMEELDYNLGYPLIKNIDKWVEIDKGEYRDAMEDFHRALLFNIKIMLLAFLFIVATGVLLTIFYTKRLNNFLDILYKGVDAMAKGDFKTRLNIKTGDEFEQLSNAINKMAGQLDSMYANLDGMVIERTIQIKSILDAANDAVICMDIKGGIYIWNKEAEEMFGYSVDEAVGKELHKLIVPEKYRGKADEGLKNFFKTGQGPVVGKVVEVLGQRKDGTEFPIELSVSAVRIGEEWQAIGIIRDISERKKAEGELINRLDELEQFRKVTIKRELRMEELKRRNKELEEELKILRGMR